MTDIEKEAQGLEEQEKEQGYIIFKKVCNILRISHNHFFYYGGYASYIPTFNNDDIMHLELSKSTISAKDLQNLTGKENFPLFSKYMLSERRLFSAPKLTTQAYLCFATSNNEKGFKFYDALTNMSIDEIKQKSSKMSLKVSLETGEFSVRLPIAKVKANNIDIMNNILASIFKNKKEFFLIKQFMALYAFEYRYGLSKPTLVLYGKGRGSGKSLFVEYFMGSIYPGQVVPAASNVKDFTAGFANKGIHYDEKTDQASATDSFRFYDELKKISGSKVSSINEKHTKAFAILSGCYIMITSNEKPFHLRDEIQDSENNQFLIIHLERSNYLELGQFNNLVSEKFGYNGLSDFIPDNMGAYIWEELFPIYQQMKIKGKNKSYRYGMDIPVTDGLKDIKRKSVTSATKSCIEMIEALYSNDSDEFVRLEGVNLAFFEHFSFSKNRSQNGFLADSVKNILLKHYNIKLGSFNHFLEEYGLILKENTRSKIPYQRSLESLSSDKTKRGMYLNMPLIKEKIDNNSWFGSEDKDDNNIIDVTDVVKVS